MPGRGAGRHSGPPLRGAPSRLAPGRPSSPISRLRLRLDSSSNGPSTDGRISLGRMLHLMLGCVQVRVRRPSWSKSPQTFAQDGCVCAARSKNEHARETDSPAHEVSCADLTSQGSRVPESRDPSPQQSPALESTYVDRGKRRCRFRSRNLTEFRLCSPGEKYISGDQKLCKCQLK